MESFIANMKKIPRSTWIILILLFLIGFMILFLLSFFSKKRVTTSTSQTTIPKIIYTNGVFSPTSYQASYNGTPITVDFVNNSDEPISLGVNSNIPEVQVGKIGAHKDVYISFTFPATYVYTTDGTPATEVTIRIK